MTDVSRRSFINATGVALAVTASDGGIAKSFATRSRWTNEDAKRWYAAQPWMIGANYIPATAVNSLEMWQAETFDPVTMDRELGWASGFGMNAMRVFLHHLLWEQDARGFKKRIDQFLAIADRHGIKTMFVLFDSFFDPDPQLGPQQPPIPGVIISRWKQGPGRDRLEDTSQYPKLEHYVRDVVGSFAQDRRVSIWDIWNEPTPRPPEPPPADAPSGLLRMKERESKNKAALTERLLKNAFDWARAASPIQPLTSAIFDPTHDWVTARLTATERIQVEQSDILSFHSYMPPTEFKKQVNALLAFDRPMLCTEYMARPNGSSIESIMPIGQKFNIGMFNWGLVDGKMQTKYGYDSLEHPYREEPLVWLHDLLRGDGSPYNPREIEIIKALRAMR